MQCEQIMYIPVITYISEAIFIQNYTVFNFLPVQYKVVLHVLV